MKAALIPPIGYYDTALKSDYHLALAQIVQPEYDKIYSTGTALTDYIIVDNGAAEGKPVGNDDLVARASQLGADEVVMPDVMKQAEATVASVNYFLKHHVLHRDLKVMAVVQGYNLDAALRCADVFNDDPRIDTLGIPRHFIDTFHDKYARMRILEELKGTEKEVHLLGTSPLWCSEIRQVVQEYPWVRGVDTSMPYNFTRAGLELTSEKIGVRRLPGYFDKYHELDRELLNKNIDTYLEWASGTEGARS